MSGVAFLPEQALYTVRLAIKHIREHAYNEYIDWDGDQLVGSDVVEMLNREEAALYWLVESRRVEPFYKKQVRA